MGPKNAVKVATRRKKTYQNEKQHSRNWTKNNVKDAKRRKNKRKDENRREQ